MVQDNCSTTSPTQDLQRSLWTLPHQTDALVLLLVLLPSRMSAQQQVPPTSKAKQTPAFEVAAIKPGKPGDTNHNWDGSNDRISIENYTLRRLVSVAYGLKSESQVIGGPNWIDHQSFDIMAKIDEVDVVTLHNMNRTERSHERDLMIQSLLTDRFNLKVSRGERKLPVFALVVTKSGAKLTPAKVQNAGHSGLSDHNGHITAVNISMDDFSDDI